MGRQTLTVVALHSTMVLVIIARGSLIDNKFEIHFDSRKIHLRPLLILDKNRASNCEWCSASPGNQ